MKTIPKLRSGLINSKDPALRADGDKGCEVVSPLSTIKQALKEALGEALGEVKEIDGKLCIYISTDVPKIEI